MGNKVLVIGSGGREHAIAKAFEQSSQVDTIYVVKGNPGFLIQLDKVELVNIEENDLTRLVEFAKVEEVALTIVGSEINLSTGIVDAFRLAGLKIVGPTQAASQLETSKTFAKEIMQEAHVKTASYKLFTNETREEVEAYISDLTMPIVIKQDGLASGKGVYIARTYDEAMQVLDELPHKKFLIEEFLEGPEFSHFSLVNGESIIPLGMARDYKCAYDNNEGPNTGGMGAFSPVTDHDEKLSEEIVEKVVKPVAKQMEENGTPFTGILYSGLIRVGTEFYVIEFNVRLGDPETQILLPRINEDFFDVLNAHLNQDDFTVTHKPGISLGVILASEGYPSEVKDNQPLTWTEDTDLNKVIFAGVRQEHDVLYSKGGRVLMATAFEDSVEACREKVYESLAKIQLTGGFFRKDIGL